MFSRYLPKRSGSSYVSYVRFGRLMTKNVSILPLLEALNECWENRKYPGVSHLYGKLLHSTRPNFIFLLKYTAVSYIRNRSRSTALHAPGVSDPAMTDNKLLGTLPITETKWSCYRCRKSNTLLIMFIDSWTCILSHLLNRHPKRLVVTFPSAPIKMWTFKFRPQMIWHHIMKLWAMKLNNWPENLQPLDLKEKECPSSGRRYHMFIESPCAVILLQARKTSLDVFVKHIASYESIHTQNAEIEHPAVPAAEAVMKKWKRKGFREIRTY